MIRELHTVHVPFDGLNPLQVKPIQLEWDDAKKLECWRTGRERRLKPVSFQSGHNRRSLALQIGERPHRAKPPDVHRIEISADDLREVHSTECVKQGRELR